MAGLVKVEFTVEPFVEGALPPHVTEAVAALDALGLTAEVGPFGTTFVAPVELVGRAVGAVLEAAYANGATYVTVDTGQLE
ncbi:MAG: thiamine-binding protein [Ilumatobacteraceae bacterium]